MVCRGTRVLVLRVFKAALCYNLAESFGKRGEGHVGMAADSCKPIDRLLRHASQRVRPVLADVRTPVFWLIALGFGLFRMWSVVAGSPTVFVPLESTAFAAGTAASLVEDVVYALLLLVAGLVAYKRPRFSRRSMIGLGAAALCGATAVFGAASLTGSVEFWAAYVARVAFACAAGVVVVWAEQLCRFSPGGILACVAVAYASAYGGALVMAALPAALCAVVQGVLPVLSALIWELVQRRGVADVGEKPGIRRGRPKGSTVACVLLGVGCYGAILLLANGFSEGKTTLPDEFLTLYVGLATSLLVALCALMLPQVSDFTLVFRLMLPILVLCVSAVFFIEAGQQAYEVVFIGFAWTFYIIFTWGLWGSMVRSVGMPAVCVFAFGSVCLSVCTLGSQFLSGALVRVLPSSFGISAGACIAAALVSTFLLNEQKVREVTGGIEAPLDLSDDDACRRRVERASRDAALTQREREIAQCVLQGWDNPAIAQELSISSATLYTHLRNIYKKTGTHGRQELVDWLMGE